MNVHFIKLHFRFLLLILIFLIPSTLYAIDCIEAVGNSNNVDSTKIRKQISKIPFPKKSYAPAKFPEEIAHQLKVADREQAQLISKAIGRGVIKRHKSIEQPHKSSSVNLKDESISIAIAVEGNYLDNIRRDGFLNYHQTGRTGGYSTLTDRSESEDWNLKLALPSDPHESHLSNGHYVRPKSAFLLFQGKYKKYDLGMTSPRIVRQYGDIFMVLNNNIKKRALWSHTDTLRQDPDQLHTFDYKGAVHTNVKNRINAYYFEALIYGHVDRNDINYIMMNIDQDLFDQEIGYSKEAKKFNVPIYSYKRKELAGVRWEAVRGRKLFAPLR
ncbi:hypothetical protein OAQ84_00575 [Bdellovibrionales bacterium]|nr:hypothetical protein [Bdellovibrionales bacterium]